MTLPLSPPGVYASTIDARYPHPATDHDAEMDAILAMHSEAGVLE